jgi:rod shape-determining protein MreD
MSRAHRPWAMPASIVLALVLGLLPLPTEILALRPYWLGLVMAYWVLEAPDRAGLGFAFLIGLLADLAFGNLLGEQALRLVVMTFILQRFRARLRFFPLSQQAFAVGALLLNDRVLVAATHLALGGQWPAWLFWLSPMVGAVLWPVVHLGLDTLRLGRWRR